MNREELKELGLSDEQDNSVMKSYGKSTNEIKEKAEQADVLQSQIDDYKEQIKERDEQLHELGEKAKGNEELTAQINELKEANETTKTEYEGKLQEQAFSHKLDNTLSSANVQNTKAVKALLDMDSIKLDGDSLLGLDDQLTALKESDGYLFKTEEPPSNDPKITVPGNPNGGDNPPSDPFADKLSQYK